MSNGKRAPTKFKKARCCSVAKTTDCLLYELDWNTYMSDLAFWISLDFFLFNIKPDFECSKTKINKQEAHHRELSYSSSPHHHLYFSISSLLQSRWFTSVPPWHTLLAQLITDKPLRRTSVWWWPNPCRKSGWHQSRQYKHQQSAAIIQAWAW